MADLCDTCWYNNYDENDDMYYEYVDYIKHIPYFVKYGFKKIKENCYEFKRNN